MKMRGLTKTGTVMRMNESLDLGHICLQCSQDMLEQITVMQRVAKANDETIPGMVITSIKGINPHMGFVQLILRGRLFDVDGLSIRINGEIPKEEVTFDNYDENIPSINVLAPEDILSQISKANIQNIQLITNLKWLIARTAATYEEFGYKLRFPENAPSFSESDISYPKNIVPTKDQKEAVRTVLNSPLSYVWGAPGTGKTQLVLASSITAHLMKGERVLIVAPTNNAVEQVLRGLLKAIENNPEASRYIDIDKDIIRMGLATSSFFQDYPQVCERKNTSAEVEKLKEEIAQLELLEKERSIRDLKPIIDQIIDLIHQRDEAGFFAKRKVEKNLISEINILKGRLSPIPEFKFLMSQTNEVNISSDIYRIRDHLFNRDIPILEVEKYSTIPTEKICGMIDEFGKQIQELKDYQSTVKMGSSKIIAMTPHTLMLYRGRFFPEEPAIKIDHVFIDEAGYANMIQMLPVFMMGIPVTFLGDHKQLAPVFQLDAKDVQTWYKSDDPYMHYASMWAMPAIYSELALTRDLDRLTECYLKMREPDLKRTAVASLTTSHRFGENLARILDRCIYHNGISGRDRNTLEITVINACCEDEGDSNLTEADAVRDYVLTNKRKLGDFAILTPYNAQVEALKGVLGLEYRDDIMTIHKSQGREWDTVIISVRDNEYTSRNLTFTSTVKNMDGARVINTAVSRAKKRLVIVCDVEFWTKKVDKNQLIRNLITEAK